MCKTFRIFSFLILYVLWANDPLQAIGGLKVEEVSGEEIKRRGILKMQYADGSAFGTAILFQEGKGWLGLGTRHCFTKICPVHAPMIAALGEEKRDVIKIYKPTDSELILFVLGAPFKDVGELPTLPALSPATSVYEGCVYGYGSTTSCIHPGSLENSTGSCRKGKLFITPLSKIGSDTHCLMNASVKYEKYHDEDFISFSSLHTKGLTDKPHLSNNEGYQFDKLTLERGYLPLRNDTPDNRLLISPSFTLSGDSGGPVIGEDNQIYALTYKGYPNSRPSSVAELLRDILEVKGDNFKELFEIDVSGDKFGLGV